MNKSAKCAATLLASGMALSIPTVARPDWVESVYAVTSPPASIKEDLSSFSVAPGVSYTWNASVESHFTIVGAETQEPAWRMLFASRCDNHWWTTNSYGDKRFIASGTVTNYWVYESRAGTNVFANGSETASRSLDEKVEQDLRYRYNASLPTPGDPATPS